MSMRASQRKEGRTAARSRQRNSVARDRGGAAVPAVKPGPTIVAMVLADEMAAAVDADPGHREELREVALAVGQWLADEARPGRWDTIDAATVLRMMALEDEVQQGRFLLTLAGLLGYAALQGHLPIEPARRTLLQIEGLARSSAVAVFAAQTAAQLHRRGSAGEPDGRTAA